MSQACAESPNRSPIAGVRWQAILSAMLMVALILASMLHNKCDMDAKTSNTGPVASVLNDVALPAEQGDCLPGHCHCVCHITADTRVALVSSPVEFGNAQFGVQQARVLHSHRGNPPFKPARA